MPGANGNGAVAAAPTTTAARVDPFRNYNFKLEIQGVTQGHFTEMSGLSVQVQAIRYREGGDSLAVRRLPGPVEYGDIVLKYGLTTSTDMWQWFMSAVKGKVERRNVSIVMTDGDGVTEVMRWDLINAWVRAWNGAQLDALGREAAIESMTLVFESLDRG